MALSIYLSIYLFIYLFIYDDCAQFSIVLAMVQEVAWLCGDTCVAGFLLRVNKLTVVFQAVDSSLP